MDILEVPLHQRELTLMKIQQWMDGSTRPLMPSTKGWRARGNHWVSYGGIRNLSSAD